MLPGVLPLCVGCVAVLQPFGPGREKVCTGQLWSDWRRCAVSPAAPLFLHGHSHTSYMGPSLPALDVRKHGCGLAAVAVFPSSLYLNGDISLKAESFSFLL